MNLRPRRSYSRELARAALKLLWQGIDPIDVQKKSKRLKPQLLSQLEKLSTGGFIEHDKLKVGL